ncbi:MAG: hypothetical protein IJ569_03840 [Prevotella sp.]|nr:hypothetical protein [Prevotella sp.]
MIIVDFELPRPDTCIVRFSGEDANFMMSPYVDTPENRAHLMAIFLAVFSQLAALQPATANGLLEKKAKHVYNLFFRYWEPGSEESVIQQIKGFIVDRKLEVYDSEPDGLPHVSIMPYKGQTAFVRWLLNNISLTYWKQLQKTDSPSFKKLAGELSLYLEYKHHDISLKTIQTTLKRVMEDLKKTG